MNELLQKLLESEILTDESKQELQEAFTQHLDKVVAEAKEQAIAETKVELHEQHLREKEQLLTALDEKVDTYLAHEINIMKEDLRAFRDLESEKVVEIAKEKTRIGEQMVNETKEMLEKLDTYLDTRIAEEFETMKSEIFEARKLEFGKKIFDAYAQEFKEFFVDPAQTENELHEAKIKLDQLSKKYKNMKKDNEELVRKVKLESVLKPLDGSSRALMESILTSVPTNKLEESYSLFINRVMQDSHQEPITESHESPDDFGDYHVFTGDTYVQPIFEEHKQHSDVIDNYKRLAGIH